MESVDPVWLFGALALATGILLGFLINRLLNPSAGDIEQLKADLESERAEMERYKASVNTHFNKTSELVNDLTQDYVKVYRHLAEGAQALSDTREFSHVLEQQKGRVLLSVEDRPSPAPAANADDTAGKSPRPKASDEGIVEDRPPDTAVGEGAPAQDRPPAVAADETASAEVDNESRVRATEEVRDAAEARAEDVKDAAESGAGDEKDTAEAGAADNDRKQAVSGSDAAAVETVAESGDSGAAKADGEDAGAAKAEDDEQPRQPEPRQQQSEATTEVESDSSKRA